MTIHLENIGRRYNKEWIFKHINVDFSCGNSYAILGPNGSGKSTLIKVISGHLSASEGQIQYKLNERILDIEQVYTEVSIAAPYVDLIEEFSLEEMIDFHFKFKSYFSGYDSAKIIQYLDLGKSLNKELKYFSSGMKQRVKLALACFSDTKILLLDEPTSNLDEQGVLWYKNLIDKTIHQNRILIVGSNQLHEYEFCDTQIQIQNYKLDL
ncbi:ABC transporter ATP-binding protein [Sphingobacterium hungaricum]|uniref:ABC transporter ATP-binding protein n=1 Tax=Sphingobacterium hungaricum TaxID=2082723 RepID=A0A928YQ38_9SPHI|nr:ATP-binding cassette domain-containing protein [Sphingobacterium hungaricum]MBE8713801.1 ABC transporter ATP-binding protein [Sphingobacterium hungaricum]